jgi:perosamine synthetase
LNGIQGKEIIMSRISLIRPSLTFDEISSKIEKIINTGIYSNGENIAEFSSEISKLTKAKYCFPTSSATTALWTCLKILDIKKGDEVLISDFSYPATVNVIEDLGAKPIFIDVCLEYFNMKPEDLEKKISPNAKAVIFVDALGNPSGINRIRKICKNRNLTLIEDAACAIGSSENGKKCGSISDLTCFSFHPRKVICAGEGGAITTNNKKFADILKIKLSHGSKIDNKGNLKFVNYGYNFRISEIQALLALVQIKKIEKIISIRQKIWEHYKNALVPLGFKPQHIRKDVEFNVQSVTFIVPSNISASDLILKMKKKEIDCSIGTFSLSSINYYLKKYKDPQVNSSFLMNNTITFPCFDGLDVEKVIKEIRSSL